MVQNVRGGNKTKRQKRNNERHQPTDKINKDDGQMFALIIKNNGGNVEVLCSDHITRIARICGKLKKGPRPGGGVVSGNFVVVSLRDFEGDQQHCDIISYGDPPSNIKDLLQNYDNKKEKITKRDNIIFTETNDDFIDMINEDEEDIDFDDFYGESISKPLETKQKQITEKPKKTNESDFILDDINMDEINFDDI